MKTHNIIGITANHYNEIKHDTFVEWIGKNTTTAKEFQLCLIDKALQNYYTKHFASLEINYVAHLQTLRKPQTGQQKLDLFFTYLKRFDCHFPKALKPKVSAKQMIAYECN